MCNQGYTELEHSCVRRTYEKKNKQNVKLSLSSSNAIVNTTDCKVLFREKLKVNRAQDEYPRKDILA